MYKSIKNILVLTNPTPNSIGFFLVPVSQLPVFKHQNYKIRHFSYVPAILPNCGPIPLHKPLKSSCSPVNTIHKTRVKQTEKETHSLDLTDFLLPLFLRHLNVL